MASPIILVVARSGQLDTSNYQPHVMESKRRAAVLFGNKLTLKEMNNMNYSAKQLVEIAASQIGYKEKSSNANLDDFTANAGSNNYTKYARDLASAGYYQASKNGYAWCDVFVDWCFYQLAGKDAKKAQELECQTGDLGAGCYYSAGYYKAQGRYNSTPKYGDQIFFKQNGEIVHTGIVSGVTSTTVSTIEGNSSNMVKEHTYSRSDSYIAGYGHPKYDADDGVGYTTESTTTSTILKKGRTGNAVKELQANLIKLGYSCGAAGADGDFGAATLAAVKQFQKDKGLTVDGEAGPITLAAIATSVAALSSIPATSGTISSTDTEKTIWDYLYSKIGNAYGAAALMGNLYAESGLKSTNLENAYESKLGYSDAAYTTAVDNGSYANFVKDAAGYGLAQWTYYTRKQNLLSYAKRKGASIGDLNMQLEFLISELTTDYSAVWGALKNATAILAASNVVLKKFENPANQSASVQNTRASYGQKYYDKYVGNSGGSATSYPTIKSGSTGSYVKKMQTALISKGYSCGSAGADGDFGINTLTALKKFQKANSLVVDGICGTKTWAALGV